MTDTLLIIALGIVIFSIARHIAKKRETAAVDHLAEDNVTSLHDNIDEETRQVLGESAYMTMTERVAEIMRRHSSDRCIAVSLTSGAAAGKGADELHHLLPGDPLWLKPSDNEGINSVGVYSGGYKVGDLMLLDADAALEVLKEHNVTGSYVCEQNCYEYYDKVSLRIIIFFEDARQGAAKPVAATETPYKITYTDGPVPLTLFQN